MTGIKAIASPSSLAFSIKKAFDEFPRLKIIFDNKKMRKGVFLKLFFCLSAEAPFFIKGVSLTNFIKNKAITAGTTENKKTRRILLSKKYKISSASSGPGTLRQALLDAQSGDTITFDPTVFPPSAPATIYLNNELPCINQGNLTIDASEAGVILDGSNILEVEWASGLVIFSNDNIIQGLQIINFSGAGINLDGAHHNTIGGDRSVGSGPIGQGNLISGNSDGIGLNGASDNIIASNLIGTDATATDAFGNKNPGIFIEDGASHNVIGLGNIIAYNDDYGIDIRGLSSIGNTITQNSIHDNTLSGINLPEGGDATLFPPVILNYDLEAGIASGGVCANCTVEIFSDAGSEGEFYEGQTIADDMGSFILNKGVPFTGSHLTATATDVDGNTSEFSVSTMGMRGAIVLQEENNLLKTQLQPKQSREIEDNRIGGQWDLVSPDTYGYPDEFVRSVNKIGLKWVRVILDYGDMPDVDWGKGEYSKYYIEPHQDKTITGLAENDIKIMLCLVFWDVESPGKEETPDYSRFKTEDDIQRYLDYVQFVVHNVKDRVEYYEILNEPSVGEGTQQHVELADYINLVKRVVPVIRQEYPEAKIVVGAIPELWEPEGGYEYFFGILKSDIMPLVDAVSFHPMYGTSPEYKYWREYYYNYPSLIQEIKDVASSHGFKGEYIADEMCWATAQEYDPRQPWIPWTYSETVAAKYYARGIIIHLGMNLIVLPGFLQPGEVDLPKMRVVQNLCTIMAGAKPVSLPIEIEIESEATNITSYRFSLSNGDTLIALWTDGIAVDEDPGIKADLTLKNFTAQDVVGIDVLKGYQQPITASSENGNLIIQNLIVRDYPLILHITKTSIQN